MNKILLSGDQMYYAFMDAPSSCGKKYVRICCSDKGVKSAYFCDNKDVEENPNKIAISCMEQLEKYFKGLLFDFDLPLDPDGTDFQKRVWECLCKIGFAQVKSYKQVALELGGANYSRAVGYANSKNPVFIIIPCHRVIANDGKLSGYAGGVEIKKWLLDHEKRYQR